MPTVMNKTCPKRHAVYGCKLTDSRMRSAVSLEKMPTIAGRMVLADRTNYAKCCKHRVDHERTVILGDDFLRIHHALVRANAEVQYGVPNDIVAKFEVHDEQNGVHHHRESKAWSTVPQTNRWTRPWMTQIVELQG